MVRMDVSMNTRKFLATATFHLALVSRLKQMQDVPTPATFDPPPLLFLGSCDQYLMECIGGVAQDVATAVRNSHLLVAVQALLPSGVAVGSAVALCVMCRRCFGPL